MTAWDGRTVARGDRRAGSLLELARAGRRGSRTCGVATRAGRRRRAAAATTSGSRPAGFLDGPAAELLTTPATTRPRNRAARPAHHACRGGTASGGYRVRRVLGRGGMGVVYEAEEIESGRRVALKVLEQRLERRARARALRARGPAGGLDRSRALRVRVRRRRDRRRAGHRHGADAGHAGGSAHERGADAAGRGRRHGAAAGRRPAGRRRAGILHRDVKPSNCFVDARRHGEDRRLRHLAIVRPTEETALSTRNQLAATPTYASPEQLRGATLDVRADIYSLGATLYELVTGRRPFTATGPDVAADGGGQRRAGAAARDRPGRSRRPEPGDPAVPRQAAGGSLRQLRRAGRGARAVRLGVADAGHARPSLRRRRIDLMASACSRAEQMCLLPLEGCK